MTAIILFFIGHWFLSLIFHTIFLHRYASHAMFTMSRFWERVFFVLTWLTQGSSYLNPRAYAIMHRRHHQYSDTDKDPHSPYNYTNVVSMMIATYREYNYIKNHQVLEDIDPGDYPRPPEWPRFERIAGSPAASIAFVLAYAGFYTVFAPSPWWFLLIPIHVLMGPIHGAIVNWCGHKYGYINYTETGDRSRNTLPVDIIMMGELFQNNHHRTPDKAGFAHKFYEFDPTYFVVRLLNALKIIHLPQTSK